jgi:hypothetical protein
VARFPTVTEEPRTTPLQFVLMVVFGVVYFTLALAIVVVLPAVAIVRAWASGFTPWGVLWGAFAALFLTLLVQALVRDRETRGWIVFFVFGWVAVFPLVARALRRLATR